MSIKLDHLFSQLMGWDEVEEYGNKRLEEEGLSYEVIIRPANKKEIQSIFEEYGETDGMIAQSIDKEKEILEIGIVVSPENLETDPVAFVEAGIIDQIWSAYD